MVGGAFLGSVASAAAADARLCHTRLGMLYGIHVNHNQATHISMHIARHIVIPTIYTALWTHFASHRSPNVDNESLKSLEMRLLKSQ